MPLDCSIILLVLLFLEDFINGPSGILSLPEDFF